MRLLSAFFLLVGLAACDSPHPLSEFAGVPPTRVEVEGSVFSVRVAGARAQAVRTNFDLRAGGRSFATKATVGPARAPRIVERAAVAMEIASGCSVVVGSVVGDAALTEARLAC